MKISGLQKLTLLDYPSKTACTVFTYGCNFRCGFCHNASLVTDPKPSDVSVESVLAFLDKRKGILDGVCITGGEPLLQSGTEEFLTEIKKRDFLVKIDTNGSFPEKLKYLCERNLVDYVAMDIKNCKSRYSETVGVPVDMGAIEESVGYLMSGKTEYEFRTTICKGLHDKMSMIEIGKWIRGAEKYFLQNFVDSGNLIGKAEGYDEKTLTELLETVRQFIPSAKLRGV